MPTFPSFIGPSYQLENQYAAIERLVNSYLLANEAGREETKFDFMTMPCPANAPFGTLPVPEEFAFPSRGSIEVRGRAFGVNGGRIFEINSAGNYIGLGYLVDGGPVCMVPNGNGQVFISNGTAPAAVIKLSDSSVTMIPVTPEGYLGASYATFQDGYILAITPGTNQFQYSGDDDTPLGDATVWSAANVSIQAGQADYLSAILSSREYVRILGQRRSQVYQNVGANGIGGTPWQSYNETFIETGIGAPYSLVDLGESLVWVGQDARGQRACWRDGAFSPDRISTFAVEQFWQGYARVDDARAFSFIWMGHLFYQITFPSAVDNGDGTFTARTWLYDATVSELTKRNIWSERTYTPPVTGIEQGRPEVTHCYAFGKHLVGSDGTDGNPGAIYQMANAGYLDCGKDGETGEQIQAPIVCDRISPHVYKVDQNVVHSRITFEVARGVGNGTDIEPGDNPQLLLRWSNDGGKTWGAEYSLPLGEQGQYIKRVYMNRLGYAPRGGGGRVYWVRCTDPVFNSLISAQLDITDYNP